MFHNIFDTVPERPVGNTDDLYFILDGGSLIHRVVWPKQKTFGDVYTTYMSYVKGKPLLHPQVIRDTTLAGAGPLVVYMGVNDLFTTSIPSFGSNTVLAMFALGGMCDGSVNVQLL
ncbi:hypothetical protein AVEN_248455-1 [Araneus ventricosus]|uniref:Uncharacterized protein n=1 Tax=Araneus ventricosus TaxID=182803 RepID=A0A4Y2X0L2_ARAVE|nr:hypothetical protein AVEN_248455-1 [Araneus ventricosus]